MLVNIIIDFSEKMDNNVSVVVCRFFKILKVIIVGDIETETEMSESYDTSVYQDIIDLFRNCGVVSYCDDAEYISKKVKAVEFLQEFMNSEVSSLVGKGYSELNAFKEVKDQFADIEKKMDKDSTPGYIKAAIEITRKASSLAFWECADRYKGYV